MRDTLRKSRGIEDAEKRVLLVSTVVRSDYVNLNVQHGSQPLGRTDWLHHLKQAAEAGLSVWPDARAEVLTTLLPALSESVSPSTGASR